MARRHRLAQRRRTVGLSQESLAEIMRVDRTTVVRWERALNDPQPWHRPRLAHALGVSAEELSELLADDNDHLVPCSPDAARPGQSAMTLLSLLVDATDHGRLRDLRTAVLGYLDLLHARSAQSPGSRDQQDLMLQQAHWWEFLSWIEDNGHVPAAGAEAAKTALTLAQRGDDPAMVSYILMRQSQQALDVCDPLRAIELAVAAQRQPRIRPRIRVLATVREAEALAWAGEVNASLRRIDDATQLVASTEDNDPTTRHCSLGYVIAHEARCRLLLGQSTQAVAAFHQVFDWATSYPKINEGIWRAQLAMAHANIDEPESAGTQASLALSLASAAGSGRTMRAVTEAAIALRRCPPVDEIQHFTAAYNARLGARIAT